jgi:hypothetical protein
MKSKLAVHGASILFVTIVLLFALAIIGSTGTHADLGEATRRKALPDASFADLSNPFQKALFGDVLNIFYPGQYDKNSAIASSLSDAQEKAFHDKLQNSNVKEHLSGEKWLQISGMYIKFIIIYVIVMLLTYYGVQTLGVWRFCRKKNHTMPARRSFIDGLKNLFKKAGLGIASFVSFCPAYVIAYSLRTELNTDTIFFMILLCVISNGLLMVYSNKFYAFLVAESRKGYVETAMAKNLKNSYEHNTADGISYKALLTPFKRFEGHVFDHIFCNARWQYLSTIKEQASFLITGMIITEMALNLHGYLSYELLRQMLYGNADIVIVMVLGIFYLVKATEIFTDFLVFKEEKKYSNRELATLK